LIAADPLVVVVVPVFAAVSVLGGAALSKAAAYPPVAIRTGVDVDEVALLAVVAVEAPSADVLVAIFSTPTLSTMLSTDGVARAGK
jgi:hypothetical protein